MNLINNLKIKKMDVYHGYIFRPDNPNKIQESVRLEISDTTIEFEYHDTSSDFHEFNKVEIILGVFNGLGNVTLLDSYQTGAASGSGARVKNYTVKLLLKGLHFYNLEDIKFKKCVVNIPSLVGWVGIRTVNCKIWTQKKIFCETHKDIRISSFDDFDLTFSFDHRTRIEGENITIKQITNFNILSKNRDLNLNEYIDIIIHFKKFLLFITNENPKSESFILQTNTENLRPIEVLTKSHFDKLQLSISATRIDFSKIRDYFEQMIKNWYQNKELNSSINLIIEKFLNPKLSVENDFLNSCFALETFHRRFRDFKVYSKSDFKLIRKEITERIEDIELRKLINDKLAFANEPIFGNRLEDLSQDFESILPTSIDVKDYIRQIVKTRNYLVHRSNDKKVFDSFDQFYAARYMECIVRINTLRIINAPEELIKEIIACNKQHLTGMYIMNKSIKSIIPKMI